MDSRLHRSMGSGDKKKIQGRVDGTAVEVIVWQRAKISIDLNAQPEFFSNLSS
jgi:hypothetical protein